MSLKELLGEELFAQVAEKAGDKKLAIVSDGNWFPKDKFDIKNQEVKDLQEVVKDRDTQLASLKEIDHEGLKSKIAELETANTNTATEYQEKLDKQAFSFALEKAIAATGARNPKAVKALLDVESVKLDGDKLLGLDTQIEALKTSDDYLFESAEKPGLRGRNPHEGGTPPPAVKNPFSTEYFNMTEQGKLLSTDPELYKQLKAQAGK